MSNEVINPRQTFWDDGGRVLGRGTITLYTDATRTTQKTLISGDNPYTLNDYGETRGDLQYDGLATIVLANAAGLEIRQNDGVAVTSDGNTGSITKYRDSVAAMVADSSLIEGDQVRTAAYYANTNIGGARYLIVASGTGTPNNYQIIALGNGLQAQLLDQEKRVDPMYAGARGDGGTDDTIPLQAVADVGGDIQIREDFEFVYTNLQINQNLRFVGGGTLKRQGNSSGDGFQLTSTAVTSVKFRGVTLDANQQNGNEGNAMFGWVLNG